MTCYAELSCAINFIIVDEFIACKGVLKSARTQPFHPFFVVSLNLSQTGGLFQLDQRLAVTPGKWGAMFKGILLVALRFLKGVRMLFKQARPFDFLLIKAECAAAPGAPAVVIREAQASRLENLHYSRLVDARLPERQMNFKVVLSRNVPLTVVLVRANCDVAVDLFAIGQRGTQPSLERLYFQLPCAPPGLR